jgi:hypothetical protein
MAVLFVFSGTRRGYDKGRWDSISQKRPGRPDLKSVLCLFLVEKSPAEGERKPTGIGEGNLTMFGVLTQGQAQGLKYDQHIEIHGYLH